MFLFLIKALIETWLMAINLRHLTAHGTQIPPGFETATDCATLGRIREYSMARDRFTLLTSNLGVAALLIFLFTGPLNWYNNWVLSLRLPFVLEGTVFFMVLIYAVTFIKIPFDLYSTFRIEHAFGFNTQSFGLWLGDFAKTIVLGTILYGVLLAGAFSLIETSPRFWWLITWSFFLLVSVFFLYVSPYIIEPLFNTFTPIADRGLETRIKELMERAGISASRVVSVDASKRSKHSNAYFSGIGSVKRIVLFDTLLASSTTEEILAVLAHEAGHWQKKHVLKRLALLELMALAGLFLAYLLAQSDRLIAIFLLDRSTLHAKLFLIGFLFSLLSFAIQPLGNWYARKQEAEADRFAVELTGDPSALANALVRISRENLTNLHPHPWYAAYYHSHPAPAQRVATISCANAKNNERKQ